MAGRRSDLEESSKKVAGLYIHGARNAISSFIFRHSVQTLIDAWWSVLYVRSLYIGNTVKDTSVNTDRLSKACVLSYPIVIRKSG